MSRGIRVWTLMISALTLMFTSGVFATWNYMLPGQEQDSSANLSISVNDFNYAPDMPEGEVTLLQRLYEILNQLYTTDLVQDSRDYLLNHTIKVGWEQGSTQPYVGSMDKDYAFELNELFGDILKTCGVSFILKNQDLNWDNFNEISLYSTSDPLDFVPETNGAGSGHAGIVAVYVSVFTPIVDAQKNVIGYELVNDPLYGFCNEVNYNPNNPDLPSFSTDDWVDNLVYWHHAYDTQPMPANPPALSGEGLYKYDYASYHSQQYYYEGYPWGLTSAWISKDPNHANTVSTLLYPKIPWIDGGWG